MDQLKIKRRTIKSACTRIKTYVDGVAANITPEVIAECVERKTKLENFWNQFMEIQEQIDILEPDENNAYRINFEEFYYATSAKIRTITTGMSTTNVVSNSTSSASGSSSPIRNETPNTGSIRLPKINLPTFSGRYDEWLPFSNVFNSLINANASITRVQKFQYLLSSLTGEALDTVKSLELSEANYDVALNLITTRYNNSRVIVHNHVKEIFELPAMHKENSEQMKAIVDGVNKHLRALKSLKRPTEQWDDIIIYIIVSKLDIVTNKEWQTSLKDSTIPNLQKLLDFLTNRYQALEVSSNKNVNCEPKISNQYNNFNKYKRQTVAHISTMKFKCMFCKGEHNIQQCSEFLKLSKPNRFAEIKKLRVCTNCLRSDSHGSTKCTSGSCRICKGNHNTLLHLDTNQRVENKTKSLENTNSPNNNNTSNEVQSVSTNHGSISENNPTLLSTALIDVFNIDGNRVTARALLDCGSQASFIRKDFLNKLKINSQPAQISISGINCTSSIANETVNVKFQSKFTNFEAHINCIVTNEITGLTPSFSMNKQEFRIPKGLILADPQFFKPSSIDILIGIDLFWELTCVGQIKASKRHPLMQKTLLGWVLAGSNVGITNKALHVNNFFSQCSTDKLHDQLQDFWKVDNFELKNNNFAKKEQMVVDHFFNNTTRDNSGRFIVKLPFDDEKNSQLGDSKHIATRRFLRLESKLNNDKELKKRYCKFMQEYEALGHMKKIDDDKDENSSPNFYLPHHCVEKQDSLTTKLRVVFDGSCKTTTGISLNDSLLVGPIIQQDLFSILARFRTHLYVVTADITKMYRQVLINDNDTKYQRIIWRYESDEPISTYELNTVTYGTSPASYLAIQCLHYIADIMSKQCPIGANVVQQDFYVDDMLTGANSISEVIEKKDQVIEILKNAGFGLDKWSANNAVILKGANVLTSNHIIDFDGDNGSKILGIYWNPIGDCFSFQIKEDELKFPITKRIILSETSKIFDPLGFLAPIVITSKLLIQRLWQLGSDWDASLPQDMHNQWVQIKGQLKVLNELKIPRCIKQTSSRPLFEIHGFCDASKDAYGACLYVRTKISTNNYCVQLLCAKSRVAPLKILSIPRLELCAAVLLAQLTKKIHDSINLDGAITYY